jgi:hypothetical protein
MKRIALLLAAVGFGSGCVVSSSNAGPCDPTSLTVDWLFVDSAGNPNLYCGDVGVDNVDVWIDGVRVVTAEPCINYAVSFAGYTAGPHDVVVEGFAGSSLVNRDWYSVNVLSCGSTTFHASPGQGILVIQPTAASCESFTTYLTYRLSDVFFSPSVLVEQVAPGASTITCSGGIRKTLPFGYYDLEKIESTSPSGATVYAAKCTATMTDVLTPGPNTYPLAIPLTSTGCTW